MEVAKVLWVDDEPTAVHVYSKLISKERSKLGIEIDVATSLEEARSKLEVSDISAVIVDCKMDPYDASVNGAAFLAELNRSNRALPSFVYSAYLDDPIYTRYIQRSDAILTKSKVDTFARPLSSDPFFETVASAAARYNGVKHLMPEVVPFNRYRENPKKYEEAVSAHWTKHGIWIKQVMNRSTLAWCVVCGFNIVESSASPFDFPDSDHLIKIGERTNLIPFAYSADFVPEEGTAASSTLPIVWSATNMANDFYPKLTIQLNQQNVADDFDTGAVRTHISDELVPKGMLDFCKDSSHLGKSYRSFSKTVQLTVVGTDGSRKTSKLTVNVVQDWKSSPFTLVNKNRKCLLGRDLFQAFELEVILNSRTRSTTFRVLNADA